MGLLPDETCPKCGAVYEVGELKLPVRDKDQFNCRQCGTFIDDWNSSTAKTYTLKSSGKKEAEDQ